MESLGKNNNHPWISMGDFNYVVTSKDRIRGNNVTEEEYLDLVNMMNINGLYEADTKGCHFTWSNKHNNDVIYYRIDHMMGNIEWFQRYQDVVVEVMTPNISNHAPIRIRIE